MGTFVLISLLSLVYWAVQRWWSSYIFHLQRSSAQNRKEILTTLGVKNHSKTKVVGYFHPYCNLGGGGERVLWAAIHYMQATEPDVVNVIYTGDLDATKEAIISKVKRAWDITLHPNTLHFVYLTRRKWVEDSTWPRFTLIGQSLGSMYLAWEAMGLLIPDLYIDTMGYAFTYHVVAWLTRRPPSLSAILPFSSPSRKDAPIPIGTYTHYPTISTTMISRVRTRSESTTNASAITRSTFLSKLKLTYLQLFAYWYALSLRRTQFVMVNSSWTRGHIDTVLAMTGEKGGWVEWTHQWIPFVRVLRYLLENSEWNGARPYAKKSMIVYPPCETKAMQSFALSGRERVILSLAQFRPEKDQATQIRAFYEFTERHPEITGVKLVQIGGVRPIDLERVEGLKKLAKELGLQDKVEFIVNAPYSEIINWLSRSSIGISTMVDEHFGINIVEYMAAGLIPITHASGGPMLDIAIPSPSGKPTGFHCTTPYTYSEAFYNVFKMSSEEEVDMRNRAREWAMSAFSTGVFEKGWKESGWKDWMNVGAERGGVE